MLANARSYSLGLLLQSAPICCAVGSGKMSSSPRSTPASTPLATSAGVAFGIGRSLPIVRNHFADVASRRVHLHRTGLQKRGDKGLSEPTVGASHQGNTSLNLHDAPAFHRRDVSAGPDPTCAIARTKKNVGSVTRPLQGARSFESPSEMQRRPHGRARPR